MLEKITITNIISVITIDNEKLPKKRIYGNVMYHNELIFKLSGTSKIIFGKQTFIDVPGSVRFLPAGTNVEHYTAETVEKGSCVDIFFDTAEPINRNAFSVNRKWFTQLAPLFTKAANLWKQKKAGYKYAVTARIYDILACLQQEIAYTSSKNAETVQPAVEYISKHFTENICVDALCGMCSISASQLKKLFVRLYGVPPKQYIISLRMKYACDLLLSNVYSVSEVAELTGYENVYYFSLSFKKIFGVSPSEYRRKQISST